MKITKEFLKEKNACTEACEYGLRNGLVGLEAVEVLRKLIKSEKLDWANWLITRCMTHEQQIRYAIYAAEQVIGIYEKKYPSDNRPRKAIEAAKKYLKNPSETNKVAAYAAAYAVKAAAYAANAAAYAANAVKAAAYAVKAAAYAAYAAAYAVKAAAYAVYAANAAAYAAYAAAKKKKLKIKILNYGLKLIN